MRWNTTGLRSASLTSFAKDTFCSRCLAVHGYCIWALELARREHRSRMKWPYRQWKRHWPFSNNGFFELKRFKEKVESRLERGGYHANRHGDPAYRKTRHLRTKSSPLGIQRPVVRLYLCFNTVETPFQGVSQKTTAFVSMKQKTRFTRDLESENLNGWTCPEKPVTRSR